jgi:rSAM/selenodomain-associated transferase 1
VKTRLAAEVGPEEAADIYRSLGRRVVDQLRGGPWRSLVFHDPPGSGGAVEEWLGPEGLAFRPQAPGELGERLQAAFQEAFREAEEVVVVGTDAPGVNEALVQEAFRRLGREELVLGPATDGGYYLLGLARPAPELFDGVPWSTDAVLEETCRIALREGMIPGFLPALSDVDRLEDWERVQADLGQA